MILNFSICILISFIFCFNAYFISKIVKKFYSHINNYLCFCIGAITYFGILQLFFFPILLINIINYFLLIIYFFAIQIIFIAFYILNWRYSLILPSFSFKKFVIVVVTGAIIAIVLLCFNNYNHDQSTLNLNIDSNVFEFPYKQATNNSLFLYLSKMFMVLFKINNITIIQYLWIFPFIIWFSCLIVGLYYEKITYSLVSFAKVILSTGLSALLIAIFSLCLNPNLSYGLGWIIPCLLLLLNVHNKTNLVIDSYKYVYLLNTICLGLFFISPSSVMCIMLLNIYFVYLNYKNNLNNLVYFNISILFAPIFCFATYLFYHLSFIWYVIASLVVIFYIIYVFIKNTKLFKNISFYFNKISKFNNDLLYLIFCVMLLLIFSIFVWVNLGFNFNVWIINEFMNKKIDLSVNITNYYLINIIWWVFNILLFIYAINVFGYKFKTQRIIDTNNLELSSYIIVWNPIAIQFWINQIPFGYYSILSVINLNVGTFINAVNKKLFNFNSKHYLIWNISTLCATSISLIGLTLFNFLG